MTFYLSLLLVVGFTFPARAQDEALSLELKKIMLSASKSSGLSVRNGKGEEVIAINSNAGLAPASTAKVISTGCSLNRLGPQFQFMTEYGYTGELKDDVLKGDLVVRGHGDPSIVSEDLHELMAILRTVHGIRKIEGKTIFDTSYFGSASMKIAEGFEGDEGRSFATVLTPTPFNQNSFSIWVSADRGDKARIALLPSGVFDFRILSQVKAAAHTAIALVFNPEQANISVSGSIERGAEKAIYRSATDVYSYYDRILHSFWQTSGGEWRDAMYQISETAVTMLPLHQQQSKPLVKVLMDINKFSLNLGAELTFLAAGAEAFGQPANYDKSMKVLAQCLDAAGIATTEVHLTNASGLSREAAVKPSAMTKFLYYMTKQFYAPEYLSTFSLAGLDGTSKGRLKDLAGRLRVKTGSIQNVRAIAGFFNSKTGGNFSFSLILNGLKGSDAETKSKEDQVLRKVISAF